jgi:hypothetical protein
MRFSLFTYLETRSGMKVKESSGRTFQTVVGCYGHCLQGLASEGSTEWLLGLRIGVCSALRVYNFHHLDQWALLLWILMLTSSIMCVYPHSLSCLSCFLVIAANVGRIIPQFFLAPLVHPHRPCTNGHGSKPTCSLDTTGAWHWQYVWKVWLYFPAFLYFILRGFYCQPSGDTQYVWPLSCRLIPVPRL